ncbi:LacI family DNA-binding transcriptional regulator [Siculibacillus lacustris]|uniref:LacI family DNA-binding transcriptional regulator n=1 Tax=Siculibacillus lacustris TaxID=1549641 RepID=A0A4Q9VW12_9HYPH|nr:LacI family DNA-binding transcriptional regulator [Siculibacillus lacustris]TBW40050.1 LacI family DNA-binding transcriptional regulator [Siculibacillus lacustris]
MPDPGSHAAVTISDVAREAGLGESTVSRVLRGRGAVSETARAKVTAAVAKLGYVPNRIAGTLASPGSRLIAFVIPSVTNIVFADVLSGAEAVLTERDRQAVFAVSGYDPTREERLIESMLAWRPSGLVVAGIEHTQRARTMMLGAGLRVVEIFDTDGTGLDLVVGFSNRAAGAASARHLVDRGRRRIGYVGHDIERDRRAGKRFEGFVTGLGEAGVSLVDREIISGHSSVEGGRIALAALVSRAPALDAVYFSNDDMALGGYFECLASGIAVPGRLALMGYNGLDVAQQAPLALTTIRTPRRRVGEMAARLLCTDADPGTYDLGFELLPGATV